ncbi:Vacuolar fusion protein MON1 [Chlorella vulgaris]
MEHDDGDGEPPSQQQTTPPAIEATAEPVSTELQACELGRSGSTSSMSSDHAEGDGSGGGTASLFADQDEGEPAAGSQQQQAEAPAPQQLATLRSAQRAVAAAASHQLDDEAEPDVLTTNPKHVFVFSTAGKPIYSYCGDESRLAGLMATAEAILSVAHSKGHTLKHIRAGPHVFAFLERPPLCLVGVSAFNEPPAVLRMQLVLVHGQIVSLLTATALSAMFARNSGYDARKLLGGSDGMLSALVDSFTTVPATLLGAYPSLPMLGGVRQALATALAAAVKATSAVHGLVVAGGQVAMLCAAAGAGPMQQWDVLLLLNLLGANQSFRHSGEAMTPVCLPRYNSAANLHAYIHYVDASSETAIVLLCGGMPDFPALSAARQHMQQQLEAVGALQAVQRAAQDTALRQGGSGFDATSSSGRNGALLAVLNLPPAAGGGAFGATPLLHLVYKLNSRQQYVMSPFSQPLLAVSADTELYLAFDPLTDKEEAARVCSRLGTWLGCRHDQLFAHPGPSGRCPAPTVAKPSPRNKMLFLAQNYAMNSSATAVKVAAAAMTAFPPTAASSLAGVEAGQLATHSNPYQAAAADQQSTARRDVVAKEDSVLAQDNSCATTTSGGSQPSTAVSLEPAAPFICSAAKNLITGLVQKVLNARQPINAPTCSSPPSQRIVPPPPPFGIVAQSPVMLLALAPLLMLTAAATAINVFGLVFSPPELQTAHLQPTARRLNLEAPLPSDHAPLAAKEAAAADGPVHATCAALPALPAARAQLQQNSHGPQPLCLCPDWSAVELPAAPAKAWAWQPAARIIGFEVGGERAERRPQGHSLSQGLLRSVLTTAAEQAAAASQAATPSPGRSPSQQMVLPMTEVQCTRQISSSNATPSPAAVTSLPRPARSPAQRACPGTVLAGAKADCLRRSSLDLAIPASAQEQQQQQQRMMDAFDCLWFGGISSQARPGRYPAPTVAKPSPRNKMLFLAQNYAMNSSATAVKVAAAAMTAFPPTAASSLAGVEAGQLATHSNPYQAAAADQQSTARRDVVAKEDSVLAQDNSCATTTSGGSSRPQLCPWSRLRPKNLITGLVQKVLNARQPINAPTCSSPPSQRIVPPPPPFGIVAQSPVMLLALAPLLMLTAAATAINVFGLVFSPPELQTAHLQPTARRLNLEAPLPSDHAPLAAKEAAAADGPVHATCAALPALPAARAQLQQNSHGPQPLCLCPDWSAVELPAAPAKAWAWQPAARIIGFEVGGERAERRPQGHSLSQGLLRSVLTTAAEQAAAASQAATPSPGRSPSQQMVLPMTEVQCTRQISSSNATPSPAAVTSLPRPARSPAQRACPGTVLAGAKADCLRRSSLDLAIPASAQEQQQQQQRMMDAFDCLWFGGISSQARPGRYPAPTVAKPSPRNKMLFLAQNYAMNSSATAVKVAAAAMTAFPPTAASSLAGVEAGQLATHSNPYQAAAADQQSTARRDVVAKEDSVLAQDNSCATTTSGGSQPSTAVSLEPAAPFICSAAKNLITGLVQKVLNARQPINAPTCSSPPSQTAHLQPTARRLNLEAPLPSDHAPLAAKEAAAADGPVHATCAALPALPAARAQLQQNSHGPQPLCLCPDWSAVELPAAPAKAWAWQPAARIIGFEVGGERAERRPQGHSLSQGLLRSVLTTAAEQAAAASQAATPSPGRSPSQQMVLPMTEVQCTRQISSSNATPSPAAVTSLPRPARSPAQRACPGTVLAGAKADCLRRSSLDLAIPASAQEQQQQQQRMMDAFDCLWFGGISSQARPSATAVKVAAAAMTAFPPTAASSLAGVEAGQLATHSNPYQAAAADQQSTARRDVVAKEDSVLAQDNSCATTTSGGSQPSTAVSLEPAAPFICSAAKNLITGLVQKVLNARQPINAPTCSSPPSQTAHLQPTARRLNLEAPLPSDHAPLAAKEAAAADGPVHATQGAAAAEQSWATASSLCPDWSAVELPAAPAKAWAWQPAARIIGFEVGGERAERRPQGHSLSQGLLRSVLTTAAEQAAAASQAATPSPGRSPSQQMVLPMTEVQCTRQISSSNATPSPAAVTSLPRPARSPAQPPAQEPRRQAVPALAAKADCLRSSSLDLASTASAQEQQQQQQRMMDAFDCLWFGGVSSQARP